MWRVALALGAIAIATPGTAVSQSPPATATADGILKLTAAADEAGWIALAVGGPDGGSVTVHELAGERSLPIARLSLRAGTAELRHATPWRCRRQSRRFVATLTDGAGGAQSATATIATPSCAGRLRMTVVPGQVRPGQSASVRVSDTWRQGGISAQVCAHTGEGERACQRVHLADTTITRAARVRLARRGPATIELRSAFGQRLGAGVEVRPGARLRVLVTGDSMIFGLAETLGGDLGRRALVTGDGHPGRGITTPGPFDWPSHARRSARSLRPDVTVVVLGAADAGYPLTTPDGMAVQCCEPAWIAAYSLSVRTMMDAYLRDGRGLVYWVILPAPKSPQKAKVMRAENEAAREAGRDDADGVLVVDRIADVLAPHDSFQEAIRYQGRRRVVRDSDGLHLAPTGIRIATNILKDLLRGDGLLR